MASVADSIADALVAAVRALALVPDAAVARRKAPTLPQGVDPPAVVVTVGEEGDTEYLTASKDLVRYPAAVTIVTAGGARLADAGTLREWREAVRKKAEAAGTFAAVPEFNMVRAGGRVPFAPPALPKDLNYTVLAYTVEAIESRT